MARSKCSRASVQSPLIGQGVAQVQMGFGRAGIDAQGFFIFGNRRLRNWPRLHQGIAQAVVGFAVVGRGLQGPSAKVLGRFLECGLARSKVAPR